MEIRITPLFCLLFLPAVLCGQIEFLVTDSLFDARIDRGWQEIEALQKANDPALTERRSELAEAYSAYLKAHPGPGTGAKAGLSAFVFWHLNGQYDRSIAEFEALSELPFEVWDLLFDPYRRAYWAKHGRDYRAYADYLLTLEPRLERPTHRARMIFEIGWVYYILEEPAAARPYFQRVLSFGLTGYSYADRAKGFLSEIDGLLDLGRPAPPLEVTTLDGQPFDLAALRGKVILLDFWSTGCKPCIQELPVLQGLYEQYGRGGDFVLLSISLDTDRERLASFFEKNDMPWPQFCDFRGRDGEIVARYSAYALPAYYIIDREGILRYNDRSRSEGVDLRETVIQLIELKNPDNE